MATTVTIKKINYKSDFELIYTLTDNEGNPLSVPTNPWELWLSVGNPLGTNVRKFIAKYDGGDYTNCRVQDDTIVVIADNHKLPTGHLWATFIDYQPNSDFPDGDKKIYTPQPCNVELITGAGDAPTETDIEILANYVVFEHEYTAGQGITIENDVISATGESYTAGNQIVIDEGTINVAVTFTDMVEQHESDIHSMGIDIASIDRRTTAVEESVATKASASDVTALANRVTTAEGSIADLTTGNNPALRASDKTTEKTIGKVAEYDDSRDTYLDPTTHQPIPQAKVPLLNTGDLYLDGVFRAGMDNKYALPHEGDEVKLRADYVLADEADVTQLQSDVQSKADTSDVSALDERVVVVETALPTKASTSSVNAIDGRVTTLENTYEDTMNIANNQLHELIDGKAMIASALTDRGYPTQATDSSASMAQKIENMSYDAGWLAQLGYSEQNDGGVKDAVAYSKAIKDGWNASETTRRFTNDTQLMFFPQVDTSQFTSLNSMFSGCSRLVSIPNLDLRNVTSVQNLFGGNSIPEYHDELDLSKCTSLSGMFGGNNLLKFAEITIGDYVTTIQTLFWQNLSSLKTVILHGGDNVTNATNAFGSSVLVKVDGLNFKSTTTGITNSLMFSTANNTLVYLKIINIGTPSSATSYTAMSTLPYWGANSDENRQSLVDSLLTYSYDRATAEYSACTIKLSAATLARLTAEEIAAITAKGFTLTS